MAIAKDSYRVVGATAPELARELNFLLQRVADRMDQIEGIRGTASVKSDLNMNLNRVTQVGPGTTTDAARVSDIVQIPTVYKVYDSDGVLIHSLGSDP